MATCQESLSHFRGVNYPNFMSECFVVFSLYMRFILNGSFLCELGTHLIHILSECFELSQCFISAETAQLLTYMI